MSSIDRQTDRNLVVNSTSSSELIASMKRAEAFYNKAAEHLCDYDVVVELFRNLGSESRRFGAELNAHFHDAPASLSVQAELGFVFHKAVGGGASLMVMEAEQGTQLLLTQYESCLKAVGDSVGEKILRQQRMVLLQVHSQLAELKHSLYLGEPIEEA
jgi:hypothetical protein